jgi:hypothetical protein
VTVALRDVPTHVLVEALARVQHGQASPPWSASFAISLPPAAQALAPFDGVASDTLALLLSAVLEERRSRPVPAEVVWTGPEPIASASRDTAAAVAGMFRDAQTEVLASVYSLDAFDAPGESLFAPLHASMAARGVQATLFFDIERCAIAAKIPRAQAATGEAFLALYWPFGPPFPRLLYDPRALLPGSSPSSMHAKTVIADRRYVLVGSANLTDRGQTRNVELGILLDDCDLAERIVAQWLGAVGARGFLECSKVADT